MKNFFLGALLLILPISVNDSFCQTAAFIGYGDQKELDSAFTILMKSYPSAENIKIPDLKDKNFNLIWIHSADTTGKLLTSQEQIIIKQAVETGSSLFLTSEAFQFLPQIIESKEPELKYVSASDQGYGRKLGLHAFISHPVFNGLNGGAYIWNPVQDTITRMWGYFDKNIPVGNTAAVDWAYIRLRESSRIVLDYDLGKGKILAAGAYTHYSPANYNKEHLELFTKNCFEYLTGSLQNHPKLFWSYNNIRVIEDSTLSTSVGFSDPVKWKLKESLNIKSEFTSDNYYDLAGERILIMGKEKGGIDEIWIHPFMAFRDYEAGIQFSYKDTIYWLNDQRPQIEISPAYIKRTYNFRRAFLTEIISADPQNPSGVIHYEYRGVFPGKLILKVKSNLRLMWPYSGDVVRELQYNADTSSAFFVSADPNLNAVIGVNKRPSFKLTGQYASFIKQDSIFKGIPADKKEVSSLMMFDLKMNDNIDVMFSGSSISKEESISEFSRVSANPYSVYNRSTEYVNNFFSDKLLIHTPDQNFNDGYKWALIASDKFFVNTPGIGKSLTAGYSTTDFGWDGEHEVNGRPGYAWYFGRDAQWSGFALLDYGDFEKVKEILTTFNKFQDVSGKIYHELTTSGAVHYDAADATPLYIILAGKYLRHSGDLEFIKKTWINIKKAIDFCYSTDTDNDKLIENTNVGHGWVEGGSLYGAHTTLYLASCWAEALKEASFIASAMNLSEEKNQYNKDFSEVIKLINSDYWNEKDSFYFYGKLKDGTFNPEKTILPSIPLYFEHADQEKAASVLNHYAGPQFTSDWGVRILSSESPLFNPSGYHYGSVWPLFTGWTSLAEYKYGNYLQGYSHMMNNLNVYRSFSKGYVSEVLNGAVYKQSGVCPHQCWSETMVLQPAIEGMLGLEVNSLQNEITFAPRFPSDWQFAEVKNIRSGSTLISAAMRKNDQQITYEFTLSGKGVINLKFNPSIPLLSDIKRVLLNGKDIDYKITEETQSLVLNTSFEIRSGSKLIMELKEGISVLPVISLPIEGDSSSGVRIISALVKESQYILNLEGKNGTEPFIRIYSPNLKLYNESGEILEGEKGIYTVRIKFDGRGNYSEKQIKLNIK